MKYAVIGIVIYGLCIFLLWIIRPKSKILRVHICEDKKQFNVIYCITCLVTVLVCILPMNLSPMWNGQIPDHRDQYERMADSFIDGKIYFDYEVDERLLEMDNPYDPEIRKELGVEFHPDHSFYNGKYYMYFGVVPVVVLFVPFKLITGTSLTTYHATQFFTALSIIGLFALFRLLMKKFFKNMNHFIFILTCISFSIMSVWYIVESPALYCTAIVSGICFEVWSLYLFFKAVYDTQEGNKAIALAFFGALFGALTFGCRPPIGLANIIAIPLFINFIQEKKANRKSLLKMLIVFLPYIIIASLLMWYNYVRFENVFEFGQSFQLTLVDQSTYGNIFSQINLWSVFYPLYYYFLRIPSDMNMLGCGMFITYPVLLILTILMINKKIFAKLKNTKTLFLLITMIISVFFIVEADSLFSPYPLPRYRMDFYWVAAIIAFMCIGFIYENYPNINKYSSLFALLMILVIVASVRMFIIPNDGNFTAYYSPQSMDTLRHIFTLGIK